MIRPSIKCSLNDRGKDGAVQVTELLGGSERSSKLRGNILQPHLELLKEMYRSTMREVGCIAMLTLSSLVGGVLGVYGDGVGARRTLFRLRKRSGAGWWEYPAVMLPWQNFDTCGRKHQLPLSLRHNLHLTSKEYTYKSLFHLISSIQLKTHRSLEVYDLHLLPRNERASKSNPKWLC